MYLNKCITQPFYIVIIFNMNQNLKCITMKTSYLCIVSIAFILCSCEKDENLSNNPLNMPKAVKYDLNDDSIDDIIIEYSLYEWDGTNSSGSGIAGSLQTLNGNSVLLKQNDYTLFNRLNDTIKINTKEPYYWAKDSNPFLVSISNSSDNDYLWPSEWKIQSNLNLDSYYLGIMITNDNNNQIGWIKMEINKSSGKIQISDKNFSSEEFIVIGK